MGLLADLGAKDKKGLFTSDDDYVMYSTGIAPLDYANGFWQQSIVDGKTALVPVTGVMGGTFISIIGTTGTGKTTLADQIGYNIIKPFENGLLFHVDAEKTSNKQRIISLCRAKYDDPRIKLMKKHTSIDDVLTMVSKICEAKEAGGDEYKYVSQTPSFDGKPHKIYVPTVFIIDSLPSFNAAEYNVDDLGNNVDGMRAARDTTRFFTNCLDRAWQYNITFIIINHIRPKTEMNQYAQAPKGLQMLSQTENLPRGYVAQYYSQTYFRINMKKSDAYTEEDNGFTGYKAYIQLAKSKTNTVGTTFPVAFINEFGFDPVYTLYEFASANGLLMGRNPNLYIEGSGIRFTRKDFRKRFLTEDAFAKSVMDALRPHLEYLLGECPNYDALALSQSEVPQEKVTETEDGSENEVA